MTRRALLAAGALLGITSAAEAKQRGEVQFGIVASYGPGQTAGPTAGLVVGVAAGRLVYLGLRGTRHEETQSGTGPTAIVTNGATVLAADAAMVIPGGPLEIMVGASIGAVRHDQGVTQPAAGGPATTTNGHSLEFLAAPSLSAELHAGPLAFIPEVQYQFSGPACER